MSDFFKTMEVLASGLSAQRTRMNLVSSNLANAETTRTPEGGPYRRKMPVFESRPVEQSFSELLGAAATDEAFQSVAVTGVASDPSPPRMVHDPGNPDADANGFVAMPNVNVVEEMVNLILAARAYEAGATAMSTVKAMAERAITIGS